MPTADPWLMSGLVLLLTAAAIAFMARTAIGRVLRRWRLSRAARRSGQRFVARPGWRDKYEQFLPGRGDAHRMVANVIFGRRSSINFELFDYRYTFKNPLTGRRVIHRTGVAAARLELLLPRLDIRPTDCASGSSAPNLAPPALAQRYQITAANAQTARALLSDQVINLLLGAPPLTWQIDGGVILLTRSSPFAASEIPAIGDLLERFLATIPPEIARSASWRRYDA